MTLSAGGLFGAYATNIKTTRGRNNPHFVQRMVELRILRKSSEVFHSGRIVDSDDPLLEERKVANYFQCLLGCYCWCHKTKCCAGGDRTIFRAFSERYIGNGES